MKKILAILSVLMLLFCVSCSKTEISDNEVTDIEDGITENEGTGNDAEKEADPDNNDVGVDYTAVVLEDEFLQPLCIRRRGRLGV